MATATRSRKQVERGGRFRVIIGAHIGPGPKGCECDDCLASNGQNHVYQARLQQHPPEYDNDVVDSDLDLCLRCNAGPHSVKFVRIEAGEVQGVNPYLSNPAPGETPEEFERRMQRLAGNAEQPPNAVQTDVAKAAEQGFRTAVPAQPVKLKTTNFDQMPLKDLMAYAEDEEIDLKGATKREDVLKIIKISASV